MSAEDKIDVENINTPGRTTRVDRAKYTAMRDAMLTVMSPDAPGLTAAEIQKAVQAHLDQVHFPGGAKVGWWMKSVQLDLEAKKVIARADTKPLRFHKLA